MAPDRVFLDVDAEELILPTNTGQVGILQNHTPLITGLDVGIMVLREKTEWVSMALMGGFALIQDNTITVLVNEAEFGKNIDPAEAESAYTQAQTAAEKAQTKTEKIETALTLKRARARYQVSNQATLL